jgi:D-alanyl-lipoteichoic acid acyltransferase DltB (MBOAT superfamily)
MIDLTVTSYIYIFCLLLGPLIMVKNLKLRAYGFLLVSLSLFISTIGHWESAVAVIIFTAFPYLYLVILRRRNIPIWPEVLIQLASFIYINKYIWILSTVGIPIPNMIKFLGVSYIFFRQLDIILQVKAKLVQDVPVVDYLNYLFSFWTILAGPIQRYRDFIQNFYSEKTPLSKEESLSCFHRAANGMIKIVLFGAFIQYCSSAAYQGIIDNGLTLRYGLALFYGPILFLYFNFSGYCDVVIAMARWAGFQLPENFDKPYLSRTVVEFWNRWHITLSQWVRDYLYQPLLKYFISGPMRKHIQASQYVSIFITFFLVGVWHGATLGMVIFGLLNGLGMAVSMMYRDLCIKQMGKARFKKYQGNRWTANLERVVTLHYMALCILFSQYDIVSLLNSIKQLPGV